MRLTISRLTKTKPKKPNQMGGEQTNGNLRKKNIK